MVKNHQNTNKHFLVLKTKDSRLINPKTGNECLYVDKNTNKCVTEFLSQSDQSFDYNECIVEEKLDSLENPKENRFSPVVSCLIKDISSELTRKLINYFFHNTEDLPVLSDVLAENPEIKDCIMNSISSEQSNSDGSKILFMNSLGCVSEFESNFY